MKNKYLNALLNTAPSRAAPIAEYLSRFPKERIFVDTNGAIGIARRQFVIGENRLFHVFFPPLHVGRSTGRKELHKRKLLKVGGAYLDESLADDYSKIIPDEYFEFWAWTNGASLFGGHLRLLGLIGTAGFNTSGEIRGPGSMALANSEQIEMMGNRCLCFGSYLFDGSELLFETGSRSVARIERGRRKLLNRWSSFWIFLTSEFERMNVLFDSAYAARDMHTAPPEGSKGSVLLRG